MFSLFRLYKVKICTSLAAKFHQNTTHYSPKTQKNHATPTQHPQIQIHVHAHCRKKDYLLLLVSPCFRFTHGNTQHPVF